MTLGTTLRSKRLTAAAAEAVLLGVDPSALDTPCRMATSASRSLADRPVLGLLLGDLGRDGLGHPHECLRHARRPDPVAEAAVHGAA